MVHDPIILHFPWPNNKLSPNARIDRRSLIAEKRQAKELGYFLTKELGLTLPAVPLQMRLLFCPPDGRRRDDDNLYASFKSYRDGIFLALNLDDRLVRRTILEWGEIIKDGEVVVEISALTNSEKIVK